MCLQPKSPFPPTLFNSALFRRGAHLASTALLCAACASDGKASDVDRALSVNPPGAGVPASAQATGAPALVTTSGAVGITASPQPPGSLLPAPLDPVASPPEVGGASSAEVGASASGAGGSSVGTGETNGVGGASGSSGAPTSAAGTLGVGGRGGGESGGSGGALVGGSGGFGGTGGMGGNGGFGGTGGMGGNGGRSGVEDYIPCPEPPEPCRIMPFGDSITDGTNIHGSYRVELFRLSLQDGKRIDFVGSTANGPREVDGTPFPRNNEGHAGYTIYDSDARNGIDEFIEPSMSAYQPHIVVLMIGTNDLYTNYKTATAAERLADLVDDIFTQDPEVLLVLTQVVPANFDEYNQLAEAYNTAYPSIVEANVAQGRHMLLVDMYSEFTANPRYREELLSDRLHPTAKGYALMAQAFYDALSDYLR